MGAIQTPALLQRSGIGSTNLLNKLNIKTKINNEYIGNNMYDHAGFTLVYGNILPNNVSNDNNNLQKWQKKVGHLQLRDKNLHWQVYFSYIANEGIYDKIIVTFNTIYKFTW